MKCLQKLVVMYNWKKDFAYWQINEILYISVVFTWNINKVLMFIRNVKINKKVISKDKKASKTVKKIVVGGPAAILMKDKFANLAEVKNTIDNGIEPILFHNPLATYTSRGCPNKCSFCAVPKIEGCYIELSDFSPRPIVCDNNFLACSNNHLKKAIDKLKYLPYIDFNQGLDCVLFSKEKAVLLSNLKKFKFRFAFDKLNQEKHILKSLQIIKDLNLLKSKTKDDIFVYILYGFKDTPEEALYKARLIMSLGMFPYPMRYQPLNSLEKNSYINKEKGWTHNKLTGFSAYWSYGIRKGLYALGDNPKEYIKFEDYDHNDTNKKAFSRGSFNLI